MVASYNIKKMEQYVKGESSVLQVCMFPDK